MGKVSQHAALYRMVATIRQVEEALAALLAEGLIPGFIHLSIGQEAVAAGVMSVLTQADTITSTHRGHGHAIAKGMKLEAFFAELLARDSGACRGRGGSMHVADVANGMLGANGIVAAGIPIALGSAFAHKTLKRDAVAVAFFGDGAMAEGLLHECLNLAKLWDLPVLFVCENNGWGEFLPTEHQIVFTLDKLAAAFGVPHRTVDGNDVGAVAKVAGEVVAKVRKSGPMILECLTSRVGGHYEGDPQRGRDPAEQVAAKARDPLEIARARLAEGEADKIDRDVTGAIAAAIAFARVAPEPDWDVAAASVYTSAA
ncbi:MAG TPA: thiamine pyrophosphate-dependent dehydrogenase E1 component subunit alpha [Alphaproteobacteria bacterium]|nr:thiamine pyrophosphate-dependent dehydrogenase E1 component subunit alpha [Alphaproteobacteria bacterium]